MAIFSEMYLAYYVLAAILCCVCVVLLRNRPLLNQILGVFMLMVLAPPASYDYTLLYIYIPWALFILFLCCNVAAGHVAFSTWTARITLVCFAVTFTSQSFMQLHWTGFGGQVKCVFMVGLLGVALLVPMNSTELETRETVGGLRNQLHIPAM